MAIFLFFIFLTFSPSRRRRSNGRLKSLKTCAEEPTSSGWWTRSRTRWWVRLLLRLIVMPTTVMQCVCACVCVRCSRVSATYPLVSSIKPCVVLSLQSRTPALVFECINNTDFKVLQFGWCHTCTVTMSIINTLNPRRSCAEMIRAPSKCLTHKCPLTGALPEADGLRHPILHVRAAEGKNASASPSEKMALCLTCVEMSAELAAFVYVYDVVEKRAIEWSEKMS